MDLRTFLFFSYASIVLGQCWKNTYSRGIGGKKKLKYTVQVNKIDS